MAVDLSDLPELASLGKTPVSPDAPAGADITYDPDYESLQREIDKLSIATAAGTPTDWNLVVHLAAGLLGGKSKDLKVAAYLAEALGRTGRMEDLAVGVRILRDLVETYWDELFPPKRRMRGRINALDWWQERARDTLSAYAGEPLAPAVAAALRDDLTGLDTALAERAEEATPLRPLIEAAARLPVAEAAAPEPAPDPGGDQPAPPPPDGPTGPAETPEPTVTAKPAGPAKPAETPEIAAAPAPQPPPAAPAPKAQPAAAQAADTSAPSTATASPAGSADAARAQVTAGLDLLFGACDALLTENNASPIPYRLARLAAWLPLTAPPPATAGKTLLPGPPAQLRAALARTLEAGNFPAAITGAESRLREFRFWLDLSRHTADGLRGLGPTHAAALDAVETETALLLRRFPGLPELRFADDTPLADAKTTLWLSRLGRPAQGAGTAPGAGAGDDEEVDAVLGKARDLAAANQAVAAAGLLQARLTAARSGRLRLRWRIGLAEILLGSGHPETARPVIDQILADLDAHDLDAFDPELAVSALVVAHQGLAVGTDETAKAKTGEVLARIMRLDPAEGLRLSGIQ